MEKGRLEAFSDGVLAVIITIMVLELKIPAGHDLASLQSVWPTFFSYVLSFLYIGIYWNNHHHMLHAIKRVSGGILWANLHLLFWLSLVPFVTNWMGDNITAAWPVAVYGLVLVGAAVAYFMLSQILVRHNGKDSLLSKAIGRDSKGIVSIFLYLLAIPFAFIFTLLSYAAYIAVAVLWIIPDRRIERKVAPD